MQILNYITFFLQVIKSFSNILTVLIKVITHNIKLFFLLKKKRKKKNNTWTQMLPFEMRPVLQTEFKLCQNYPYIEVTFSCYICSTSNRHQFLLLLWLQPGQCQPDTATRTFKVCSCKPARYYFHLQSFIESLKGPTVDRII